MRPRLLAAALTGALVTLLTAVPASATSWTDPFVVARTTDLQLYDPVVAINGDGAAVLVWDCEQPSAKRYLQLGVCARLRLPDGTLTPLRLLAPPQSVGQVGAAVIDETGAATVVWTARKSSQFVVRAVRLAADGTVGQTVDIGRPFGGVDHVSIDAAGDVTVLARSTRSLWESWVRVLHPDGTLDPVQVLDSGFPLEAVPTADGLAVLTATFETERANPLTLTVLADGADPVEHLVTGHLTDEFRSSDLAVSPDGTLTVAWAQGGRRAATVYTRDYPAVGEATQPQAVTGDLDDVNQLRLASTGDGRVFAAWIQGTDLWSMALPSDIGTATGAADGPVKVGSGYYDVHAEATNSSVMFFGLRDGNRTIAVQSWDGTGASSRVHAVLSDPRFDNDRGNVHYATTSSHGTVAVASARWMAAKGTQKARGRVELALTR